MKANYQIVFLARDQITVLPWVQRGPHPDDHRDSESIRKGGIHEPLVVIEKDGAYLLVKGSRRLRLGAMLGIPRFRCSVDPVPPEYVGREEAYIADVRLALSIHRQGLPPSVEAGFLATLKERFGFNNLQLSRYRGIDPDTVTNYMAVNSYIQPLKDALDAGAMSMTTARAFNGLSQLGQERIWTKHRKDLIAGTMKHEQVRTMYRPAIHPAFYTNPEKIEQRLNGSTRGRKRHSRTTYTPDERKSLMASVDVKHLELEEFREELRAIKERCKKASIKAPQILRNRKLRKIPSEDEIAMLKRFCESQGVM